MESERFREALWSRGLSAAVVFWEVRLHPMNGSGLGKVGKQVIALFVSEQHTFLLEDGS